MIYRFGDKDDRFPRKGITDMPQPSRRAFIQLAAGGTAAAAVGLVGVTFTSEAGATPSLLDEVYKGHQIQIRPKTQRHHSSDDGVPSVVYVDGIELHVMEAPGKGYISFMNHYRPFPTLPKTARAAVDQLGSAKLLPLPHHS